MKAMLCLVTAIVLCAYSVYAKTKALDRSTFVRDFYAAYTAKDADKLAQFYATDATFVDPSFELNLKGSDQIRDLLKRVRARWYDLRCRLGHECTSS